MARGRREGAPVSLEEIFERTRVRMEFLRGIEEGNYQGFPDLVYTKGFVRTYLSVIGAEDMKDEFMSWLDKETAAKAREMPPRNVLGNGTLPTKGFKPASHFWLFVVLFLILMGSGGYVWYSWANGPILPVSFPSGLDVRRLTPNPANSAEIVSDEVESDDVSGTLVTTGSENNFMDILPVSPSIRPEPEPVKPHLLVKARADVWMKVTIAGRVVYSNTLKSGSQASWDLPSRAQVTYGRPREAEVVLNGKELGVPNPRATRTETYWYEPDGTFRLVQ
jgi:cytoskeletal protein RodZ